MTQQVVWAESESQPSIMNTSDLEILHCLYIISKIWLYQFYII